MSIFYYAKVAAIFAKGILGFRKKEYRLFTCKRKVHLRANLYNCIAKKMTK